MKKHYVVCGFPRAGSTLLYNCLRHTVKNAKFCDKEISALQMLQIKESVVTKRPMDIFKCHEIANKTEAKFIITIRDPRDVLTSVHANSEGQFKVNWNYSLKTSKTKGVYGKTSGLLDYYEQLDEVSDPVFVYYEDFVSNPIDIQILLEIEFPELEFKGKFEEFMKSNIPKNLSHQLNGVRKINAENVGRWRKYPERIKKQFKECPELYDILIDLGYEKDREWIKSM